MDRVLDTACSGPLFLRMPEIAKMVMDAIHYRDQRTYPLHSFVVMPNHVHLLMTPLEAVSKVMQSLKRFTATWIMHTISVPSAGPTRLILSVVE